MANYVLQEDGVSKILLEDLSGALLQEGVDPPFIASKTIVYAPAVPEVTAPFIGSVTTVHAPTVAYTGGMPELKVAGTYKWLCPPGVTSVTVEAIGAGGDGTGDTGSNSGFAAGGGGAYAIRYEIPVTPGTVYTFTVGAGGIGDGGSSSFTGDSSISVIAVGGKHAVGTTHGAGGLASACTGDAAFNGGNGGDGSATIATGGAGGGASGNRLANGTAGTSAVPSGPGEPGGTGANGGGAGGQGGANGGTPPGQPGVAPGGGGGGGGGFGLGGAGAAGSVIITVGIFAPFISSRTTLYAPALPIDPPFIASHTVVYSPSLPIQLIVPFIGSHTTVYSPNLPEVHAPFIASKTHVWGAFILFDPNKTYSGPGNGGEPFLIRLNANGVTDTATLAANITASATALTLTGDGSLPSTEPFVATIDAEVLYLVQLAPGSYRIRGRGLSNTTPASHTAGATVSWGDSYDMAIRAGADIAHSFTADINSTGSFTYYGWLICFDSSQAYKAGSRYPMHVSEVLGVFAAGAGSTGSNRCDASQPNAVAVPVGVSDDCPAALSNPSLITFDITAGDVAVVRYTNPEAVVLDLGPRSTALQSWFGLKRVDATDADVTLTDPTGYVVDTIPSGGGPGPFTGSVEEAFAEPLPLATGIAPDASDTAGTPIDTPNPVPWMTVTLPGSDRYFTIGSGAGGYDEKGWPICCIAVRQGNRRVPLWQSWDWKDYNYVYAGFGTDDTFAQLLVNRNGITFDSVPAVDLPGPQDIDGPDVVWDDPTYYYACAWYVALFSGPYLVFGPSIGGTPSGAGVPGSSGYAPGVSFPTVGGPSVTVPPGSPPVEGGSGGNISPGTGQLFQAASV